MLDAHREERLARTLADEAGADPDDLTPWLVSAQICAVVRALTRHFAMRQMAGEPAEPIRADIRKHAERAFDLLERGIGGYCPRHEP
jgi:hypothetical protein